MPGNMCGYGGVVIGNGICRFGLGGIGVSMVAVPVFPGGGVSEVGAARMCLLDFDLTVGFV